LVNAGDEAARKVDDGAIPMNGDGEEDVDDVRLDAARTGARSAASISSWSFEEGRPERLQAAVRCR
jgi:hypothetical protein